MSEHSKHTPGPWGFGRSISDCCHYEVFAITPSGGAAAGEVIAGEYGIESAANARLMASTTDLLAALRPFAETPTSDETPGVHRDEEADALIYAARAAIAKATQ